MNAMKIILVALTLVASQAFAEEKVDTEAAKEYFKHAGQATDPSYQDYVSTNQESGKKEKATDTSYTDQQKQIKERVKNSPKYTVPLTSSKGAYGQAK
ncbi:hypothetical protein [Geomobilimonas luticola]|uniref:Uncharacterized protein n=1 Tax=Geomobilimonas luticola TaxID=1114878 RepID=A0ABS5SD23_9BACT|nr:hypothetical protein [Geomobilimonas luticola]MBT0653075.1 hypothetical protein [Geomobilimonas luticola]